MDGLASRSTEDRAPVEAIARPDLKPFVQEESTMPAATMPTPPTRAPTAVGSTPLVD